MHNLLSLVLELQPSILSQFPLKPWYGWASQSIVLRAVRQAFSSNFSSAMHLDHMRRAYTASSLFSDQEMGEVLSPEGRYFIRFTALNGDSTQALISTTLPGQPLCPGRQINLSGLLMNVVGVYVNQYQHPLADATSYEALCDRTVHAAMTLPDRMTFRLLSPTFFKSTQTGHYTQALTAALVFGSLFDRWKLFAHSGEPGDFLAYVSESIHVLEQELDVETIEIDNERKYKREGAKGWITFTTHKPDSSYWVFAHVLAHYALFAGIGKETARGFGQCQLLHDVN